MDRQQLCLLGAGVSAFGPLHSKADIPFSPPKSAASLRMVTDLRKLKRQSRRGPETIRLSFWKQTLFLDERPWNTPRKDLCGSFLCPVPYVR